MFTSGTVYAKTYTQSCVDVNENLNISNSTEICSNNYNVDDYGDIGVIVIKESNVTLNCNGAKLTGHGKGIGIYIRGSDNVTVTNCQIDNYMYGIYAEDSHKLQILNMGNKITNTKKQVVLDESTLNPTQLVTPSTQEQNPAPYNKAEVRATPTQVILPSLRLRFDRINSKRGDLLKIFAKDGKKADDVKKDDSKKD